MQGLSGKPGGTAIALSITAVLFGLAHLPGGIDYVMLATVAGIGYGWSYYRTGHIEAAILTHFTLNALHFLLFTYSGSGCRVQLILNAAQYRDVIKETSRKCKNVRRTNAIENLTKGRN